MQYRAYVIGKTGHVMKRHDFEAADDAAAMAHAREYATRDVIEVWQLTAGSAR